eukprot:Gb_28932 [translate_table: standard]
MPKFPMGFSVSVDLPDEFWPLLLLVSIAALDDFFNHLQGFFKHFLSIVGLVRINEESTPSHTVQAADTGCRGLRENNPIGSLCTMAEGECTVCLCRFDEGGEVRRLACCHYFHKICIEKWVDCNKTTCPLCRSPLV